MTNAKRLTNCANCGKEIFRRPINHNTGKTIEFSFCDNSCKGMWQRENLKPSGVDREWLIDKYVNLGMNCVQIGESIGRNPKRVWEWLRDYGIETRPRGSDLSRQWKEGIRTTPWIGRKHSDSTKEKIRMARIRDGRVPYLMPDGSHYMKGRRGPMHHSWQGGLTPEREALSHSDEWISVVKEIWKRADAKCERCGKDHRSVDDRKKDGFHIHHIKPFRVKEYRCDPSNLVLLCRPCHNFVHSRNNVSGELIDV